MKKILMNFAHMLVITLLAYCTSATSSQPEDLEMPEENEQQQTTVLVFSKTNGFRHDSIEPGIEALQKLANENNFRVVSSEDSSIFTPDQLSAYQAIIFLNTTGDILNEDQQLAMEQFIQNGGGFVGVHSAADTEYDWPWYGKLVGAYFNGHPGNPNVREATLHIVDNQHPATKDLPQDWTRSDEWYNYKSINEENQDLIMLDETTYEGGTNGEYHPICWYKEFDGGRAFYTGSGHTKASFEDETYLKHLLGGIRYALGDSEL